MQLRRFEFLILFIAVLAINWGGTMWWLSNGSAQTAWARGGAASATAPLAQSVNIPRSFSYQGTLRDANGNLINGQVKLRLRLYSAPTGGSALHDETFNAVIVRNGGFSVVVGDAGTPIGATVFNNAQLFLGLTVNNDSELTPRQRLHPVPWAMQASTAQSAVTAINLAQGGGVPNLVKLGNAGLSEVAFLPNNGKIANDANGLTLDGGNNKAVKTAGGLTVGGDLTVVGGWNASAIREKGNGKTGVVTETLTYPVSLRRYVLEASDGGSAPNTVPVNNEILTQFCQDEDGCTVSLYMRNWNDAAQPGLLAGVSAAHFSLAAVNSNKREWDMRDVASNGAVGIDNNGTVNHLMNIYNACFFTDGEFVNGQGSDAALGFGLLNWHGAFDSVKMTCVLVIED
jgi:hypothetical protein